MRGETDSRARDTFKLSLPLRAVLADLSASSSDIAMAGVQTTCRGSQQVSLSNIGENEENRIFFYLAGNTVSRLDFVISSEEGETSLFSSIPKNEAVVVTHLHYYLITGQKAFVWTCMPSDSSQCYKSLLFDVDFLGYTIFYGNTRYHLHKHKFSEQ